MNEQLAISKIRKSLMMMEHSVSTSQNSNQGPNSIFVSNSGSLTQQSPNLGPPPNYQSSMNNQQQTPPPSYPSNFNSQVIFYLIVLFVRVIFSY